MCIIVPNFVPIVQIVLEILPFFDFSRWRLSTILDLFYTCLDHPETVFGGLCHRAKFGWNQYSSFDNMQFLIFNT